MENNIYDIAIVGGGPAGLTAAIFARRANMNVIVFERLVAGGQVIATQEIYNYPGYKKIMGHELAQKMLDQAKDLGAHIKYADVISLSLKNEIKQINTLKETFKARAVILALGASARKLGIENEQQLEHKGVTYCAKCDGSLYKDKTVAVNGGGNSAIDNAIYLAGMTKKVYVVHRSNFRADASSMDQIKNTKNIELVETSIITKLNGVNQLESIEVTDTNTKKTRTIKLDGLFVSIGRRPDTDMVSKEINLDEGGYIVASEDCKTNIDGVYVAGDCRNSNKIKLIVSAAADGAISADGARKYVAIQKAKTRA